MTMFSLQFALQVYTLTTVMIMKKVYITALVSLWELNLTVLSTAKRAFDTTETTSEALPQHDHASHTSAHEPPTVNIETGTPPDQ